MRRSFPYILAAFLVVLSCEKDNSFADEEILLMAEEGVSTKALLEDQNLKTTGNRIHVMDVLAGFTGQADWMQNNLYVNDEIVYTQGNIVWGYQSGRTYPWTTDGVHQFFGWLSYDTNLNSGTTADSFFGSTLVDGFSSANRTLTLPSKTITSNTATTPQFDFLYGSSGIYEMPRPVNAPVPLSMQHLFSAISLQFLNESGDAIIVHDVTIGGLKSTKSAVINFSTAPTLTVPQGDYPPFVDASYYASLPLETRTLENGATFDLLAQVKHATAAAPEFRLLWPQTAEEMAPSNPADYLTYPMTIHYEYANDEEVPPIQHTAHLRFPEGVSFNAGTRYSFTLLFTQKHVQLSFRVNPWNYELNEWSFMEQSISEVKELDFKDNPGYDKPSKTCRILGGSPVKGTFSIVNPSGAIWSIEPVGDVEYFTLSPSQGTIDSENPDYEFYVIPNLDPSLDRSTDKKLKFRFYVRFTDGSFHAANSEINRDDWTVILPKN